MDKITIQLKNGSTKKLHFQRKTELINSLPWTELQLAHTKLEKVRRYMYTNNYSDADVETVLKVRQKRMNCVYTGRCRNKLKEMVQEREELVKIKENLLKEITELKSLAN